ncbi:MAG: hypothetical protein NPIRA02_41880 [Nitrospirales bacterium]|nr:MAG: hypothetical protein NPIRA02_41880 [Nitrospirales bacterium]
MVDYRFSYLLTALILIFFLWVHSVLGVEADPGEGKVVYEMKCLTCHGPKGKGDGPTGKFLMPPPGNLTTAGAKSAEELRNTIRNGRAGTGMPPFRGILSEKEIEDVLAYVRTLAN